MGQVYGEMSWHAFLEALIYLQPSYVPPPPFRAGYLTLFGGEQNNNCVDAAKVYMEYQKFDSLLIKMARTTLKSGQLRCLLQVHSF